MNELAQASAAQPDLTYLGYLYETLVKCMKNKYQLETNSSKYKWIENKWNVHIMTIWDGENFEL